MGKTAVFVISVLQQLDTSRTIDTVKVLVLCHTHELAQQISTEFLRFSKHFPGVTTCAFYGGIPMSEDIRSLKEKKPAIVVGTPGRIKQLVKDRYLDVSGIAHFVLDECDKLLEKIGLIFIGSLSVSYSSFLINRPPVFLFLLLQTCVLMCRGSSSPPRRRSR
jgi:superfamily II DNA/RNA helicase